MLLQYILIDIYKLTLLKQLMAYYKDVNQELDYEKTSRINAAGIINITLENLWRDSYSSMAKVDLITWNRKLDAIWAILGGDCKENSAEEKTINRLDLKIYSLGTLKNKIADGFKETTNPNFSLQYQLLKRKSLFLRRLQNFQGKGTAYHVEDEDDF